MAITAFRQFANGLRNPAPYVPLITELKGVTNLTIGLLQLSISVYMRYSSNPYHRGLTNRHVEIGTEAVKRGVIQLAPAAALAIGTWTVGKIYTDYSPPLADRAAWFSGI